MSKPICFTNYCVSMISDYRLVFLASPQWLLCLLRSPAGMVDYPSHVIRPSPRPHPFSLASCFRSSCHPLFWQHFPHLCSSLFLITFPYHFSRLSVNFLETCITIAVSWMFPIQILYLHETPHIHRSILRDLEDTFFLSLHCSPCLCSIQHQHPH